MPPTATLEDIKAHQQRVEKNKINPDDLPPCPRCLVESVFFKFHAFRERRFLIIIDLLVEAAYCSLLRFRCPGCGKTFTHYPEFAVPHKHYTQPSITGFSDKYIGSDDMTYQKSVMDDGSVPGYPDSDATLAPSTVHRWITTVGQLPRTCRTGLSLLLQDNPALSICRDLARLTVARRKYKTEHRRKQLIGCRHLVVIEAFFQLAFKKSIFTKLAMRCAFG
jgi:hypothetical protein